VITFAELRPQLPVPVLPSQRSGWLELYWRAWELAVQNIRHGTPANGFVESYIDAAFSENIFQWDTCFIVMFARYAWHLLPVGPSLDNFYRRQDGDGWICREYRGHNGAPMFAKGSADAINPPLFSWAEWALYQLSGDRERLARVWSHLVQYDAWLRLHQRGPEGLYWSSRLGCGMDNTPRFVARWVDMSAQQALNARCLATIAQAIGQSSDTVAAYQDEHSFLARQINRYMWDEEVGMYWDLDGKLEPWPAWTIAPFWTLIADVVPSERRERLVAHLRNPARFWRAHPFPTLSADHPAYHPDGGYWMGAVWAPTNYAVIKGLRQAGFGNLAHEATVRHLDQMLAVFHETGTLWENYAPDMPQPGKPAARDFVGWSGVGPIALLIEEFIGLEVDAAQQQVRWRLEGELPLGLRNLRLGDNVISLVAERDTEAGILVRVEAVRPFRLEMNTPFTDFVEQVPAGSHQFTLAYLDRTDVRQV
jgi:glycogen debranching enzyme